MEALTTEFKAAFRNHPAGVALITAETPEGPVGLTASSVASVAVDPPAISFSLTRATGSAGGILGAETFLVHLLGHEHSALAESFARSGEPRFTAEQGWTRLPTGEPYYSAAPIALRCRFLHRTNVGSSVLIAAEVIDLIRGPESGPLLYHDRVFLSLAQTAPVTPERTEK